MINVPDTPFSAMKISDFLLQEEEDSAIISTTENDRKNLADTKKQKTCKRCGKDFVVSARYIGDYRYTMPAGHSRKDWFCSWTCLSRYRKERNKKNGK